MATRNSYLVTSGSLEELLHELNLHFQSLADRLDKIEGIRGKPDIEAASINSVGSITVTDENGQVIHSFSTVNT